MFTCSKTYPDIPFAHRQHRHSGDCTFVHGHNWAFKFTFGCETLTETGFVVDFGKLKFIREWLLDNLDHAYVYNEDDADTEAMLQAFPKMFKAYKVPSCSTEGIAKHAFEVVSELLLQNQGDRVYLVSVEVSEDSKNSAVYRL